MKMFGCYLRHYHSTIVVMIYIVVTKASKSKNDALRNDLGGRFRLNINEFDGNVCYRLWKIPNGWKYSK